MRPERALELWGGVECTVNRVGNLWMDQIVSSGHNARISDLDLFAGLGLRTLRYPFLWERMCPEVSTAWDWSWADQRMRRLTQLDIQPIAGLLHHGSGPPGTDLSDPAFPDHLASYAMEFARRFPKVRDYTPVNEPLTTARFSGLYGLWYPHGKSDHAFITALFHQCQGVVLAMQGIRKINPEARLVQTEDLGQATSTPPLAAQADFENERRWLSLDLLCGKVTQGHPLWNYLRQAGFPEDKILWFAENACPPDLIGINHYVSSNRHLDHRRELFAPHCHAGNGQQQYADTEAVRIAGIEYTALNALLLQAWNRYGLPLAITEAHLACTREEQMRWLKEIWDLAGAARAQGADVRAVTAWGLLGLYDWHCLLTRKDNCYEPGVYDVSGGHPRPTALAAQVRSLARTGTYHHPLLEVPGWWHRDISALYPEPGEPAFPEMGKRASHQWKPGGSSPLIVIGGDCCLGEAFRRVCGVRGIPWLLINEDDLHADGAARIEEMLGSLKPWALVYAKAYAWNGPGSFSKLRGLRTPANQTIEIAAACGKRGIPMLTFTPDLIFDGQSQTPYHEDCLPTPPDRYASRLVRAERAILTGNPRSLVVRTGSLFGPWDSGNFLTSYLDRLRAGRNVRVRDEATISVTYIPDMVNASLDLLVDEARGVWHLVNRGETCQAGFLRSTALAAQLDTHRLRPPLPRRNLPPSVAPRPAYRVLSSIRGGLLPPLEEAADRYLRDYQTTI